MNFHELNRIHHDCSHHRALVERSKVVGCFWCRETYPPSEIVEWIDGGTTALCPKCDIDAVLPDSVDLSEQALRVMHNYWFTDEQMR